MTYIMGDIEWLDRAYAYADTFEPTAFTEEMPSRDKLAAAKIGELGVERIWAEFGPVLSERKDDDKDITFACGFMVDVKNLDTPTYSRVIWPRKKGLNELLARRFHALIVTRVTVIDGWWDETVTVAGVVSKRRFVTLARTAASGDDTGLQADTIYINVDELAEADELTRHLTKRRKRMPQQYLNDHACSVCGAPDAPYGFSAPPDGPIHKIQWRCREHW
jgi:hypothetical protein